MIGSIREMVEKVQKWEHQRYVDFIDYADGCGIGKPLAEICYDVMYGETPKFAPLIDENVPHRINFVVQPLIAHVKLSPIA